jgi:hypothetical protein
MTQFVQIPKPQAAAGAPPRAAAPRQSLAARLGFAVFSAAVIYALYWGWTERGEEHLTPEKGVGYGLGIAGGSMMLVLLLYPLRKRLRFMRTWGRVADWFRIHMLLGIIGPLLVLYHANFQWGSLNSNVALAAMLTVVASGLVGRFIHARIHHGLYGRRANLGEMRDELAARRAELNIEGALTAKVEARLKALEAIALAPPAGLLASLGRYLALAVDTRIDGPGLRRALRLAVRKIAGERDWTGSARRRASRLLRRHLNQYLKSLRRIAAFACYERLFAAWHVLHMPLFVILFVTAVFHVIAVHMY